jgi:hypothetical protein
MKLTQGKIKSHGKTLEIASSAVISYSQAKTHTEALDGTTIATFGILVQWLRFPPCMVRQTFQSNIANIIISLSLNPQCRKKAVLKERKHIYTG